MAYPNSGSLSTVFQVEFFYGGGNPENWDKTLGERIGPTSNTTYIHMIVRKCERRWLYC